MLRFSKTLGGKRITIIVEDAETEWQEVLDAIEVVPDEHFTNAPWEDSDGWEHTADELRHGPEHNGMRESIRYVSGNRAYENWWLTLDIKKSGIPTADYFRAQGASKQVAAELAAMALRQAYSQLHKWYANGWQYWGITGNLHDCHASCWGFLDDYGDSDYMKESKIDIAHELASKLEEAGYVITNQPAIQQYRPQPKLADYLYRKANGKTVDLFNTSKR